MSSTDGKPVRRNTGAPYKPNLQRSRPAPLPPADDGEDAAMDMDVDVDSVTYRTLAPPSMPEVLNPHELELRDFTARDRPADMGPYMVARLTRDPSRTFAIKRYDIAAHKCDETRATLERKLLQYIQFTDCEQITNYFGAFYHRAETGDLQAFVVCEYMDHGSLASVLNAGADIKALAFADMDGGLAVLAAITALCVNGIAHMHQRGRMAHTAYIYRALTEHNILLHSDGHVKIADFGPRDHKAIDALYYSPQRTAGEKYSHNEDLWSLGITLYKVAYGKYPTFRTDSGEPHFPDRRRATDNGDDKIDTAEKNFRAFLIEHLLIRDAAKRPRAHHAFKHIFIRQYVHEGVTPDYARSVVRTWLASLEDAGHFAGRQFVSADTPVRGVAITSHAV